MSARCCRIGLWSEAAAARAASAAALLLLSTTAQADALEPPKVEATAAQGGLGALEGFVRFVGPAVPAPTRIENSTDPEVCGSVQTLEDMLVSAGNRGVGNAIVALAGGLAAKASTPSTHRLVLDNRDCRFVPHVAVLAVGSTIEVRNSDPLSHNAHLYGAARANIALLSGGRSASRTLTKPGMIIVKCDLHGWMQAFIRVDDHPFHAVTDGDGHFRISEIPVGTYTIELWHERLGRREKHIRIESEETAHVEFEYSIEDD